MNSYFDFNQKSESPEILFSYSVKPYKLPESNIGNMSISIDNSGVIECSIKRKNEEKEIERFPENKQLKEDIERFIKRNGKLIGKTSSFIDNGSQKGLYQEIILGERLFHGINLGKEHLEEYKNKNRAKYMFLKNNQRHEYSLINLYNGVTKILKKHYPEIEILKSISNIEIPEEEKAKMR